MLPTSSSQKCMQVCLLIDTYIYEFTLNQAWAPGSNLDQTWYLYVQST